MARATALALCIWLAAFPAAGQAVGKIRICRVPGLTELMDRQTVPIPKGTIYTSGDDQKTGDQLQPYFTVHTTEDAILPPKPGCVVVGAQLNDAPAGFALTTKYPTFLPSQLGVAGLSDIARVAADFH